MKHKPRFKFEDVFTDEFFDLMLRPGEEALQEGLKQGLQEGERQALQSVLRDVLAGEDVEERIAAADNGQLRAWIHTLIAERRPGA